MGEPARVKRLTGYCNRCGGDCYDDGVRNYHRCPPKRAEAGAVAQLKLACDGFDLAMSRRAWAKMISREDCDELVAAIHDLRLALDSAYPSNNGGTSE